MKKRNKRRLWLIPLVLLAALALAFGAYVSDYYRASEGALAILTSTDGPVRVSDAGDVVALEHPEARAGLVFYPGGKVQAEAYLPLLKLVAGEGIDCYLVRMPFNLALFGQDRAASVMAAYPHDRWFLAGHSLGGAMAAGWAAKHPGTLEGLALLAAYPISELPEGLKVLTLYGSEDGVLNRGRLEKAAQYLPEGAVTKVLPGGNHAQFGDYGAQKGDGEATISPEAQWAWTVEKIMEMIG